MPRYIFVLCGGWILRRTISREWLMRCGNAILQNLTRGGTTNAMHRRDEDWHYVVIALVLPRQSSPDVV
jgi:hypothetical protein